MYKMSYRVVINGNTSHYATPVTFFQKPQFVTYSDNHKNDRFLVEVENVHLYNLGGTSSIDDTCVGLFGDIGQTNETYPEYLIGAFYIGLAATADIAARHFSWQSKISFEIDDISKLFGRAPIFYLSQPSNLLTQTWEKLTDAVDFRYAFTLKFTPIEKK